MPADVQHLMREMASANRPWGEERIAAELLVKLGLHLSPRTVRRYMPTSQGRPRTGAPSSQWSTFVRNHATAVLACDFFVAISATFRTFSVLVVLDVGTRRIRYWNVTDHPPAEWTTQQFRMVISGDEPHRFLIHDRDSIYCEDVARAITAMGLTILKTPVRAPQANAFCERLIGTLRRECLDWVIPLNEDHLRTILREWIAHYNSGRPPRASGLAFPTVPLARQY
ncbi:MAG TPA: integrase core domain-containing protein [Vicinamibacterales bacterium]|nr:integrase core domain-containing protein [Vicinamibacterales bacterium]